MQLTTDRRFMLEAIRLARRGQGHVEPNPMVGAVLVRDGKVVARGYHRRFGGPHAEVEALRDAWQQQVDPRQCVMYVTLEPCSHHGKTPPCCDALIEAGVPAVDVAMVDPFAEVAGRGIERLRAAGINVRVGIGADEAAQLNEPYLKRVRTGRPWVIAKWAQTLDGRIATASGHSQWISNAASRRIVHRLRGRVDAVMTGIGTIVADDPQLTARVGGVRRIARRVVVDRSVRINLDAQMLHDGGPPVIIGANASTLKAKKRKVRSLQSLGVELTTLPIARLLEHLAAEHAATNVLVEAGPTLLGAMMRRRLVDQLLVFAAPKLLGDATALPAVAGFTRSRIDQADLLHLRAVRRIDDDVLLDYRVT